MDTRRGTLHDDPVALSHALRERPGDVETFNHDEVVEVKTGFFLVAKVDIRRQRLVLKPISAVEAERRRDLVKRDAEIVAGRAER
jgi:hypothetical protein